MPPRSYKKNQKAVHKKPKDIEIEIENPEPGLVYNIYQCQDLECVLPHNEDKMRPKFKRSINVPWRKKKSLEQCCAKHQALLKIKYKKCQCGAEFWGTRLKSSVTCKFCGTNPEVDIDKAPTVYYRLGEYHKKSDIDLGDPERADCINRPLCLKVTFEKGAKKGIACKDCPYYSSEFDKEKR